MRSLKVVVQRALIDLPESLLRKCSMERGRGKGVVKESEKGENKEEEMEEEEMESQLVTCQSCAITVHKGQSLSCMHVHVFVHHHCSCRLLWRARPPAPARPELAVQEV